MKMLPVLIVTIFCALNISAQKSKTILSDSSRPFVLGITDQFRSRVLNENRIVNIYFPEGYNKNDTTSYDVAYLLDGSADEDFIHVAGLYQFNSFEWISRVPKTILVGIATVNRRRDFTFPSSVEVQKKKYPESGHSDKFIKFIAEELQPFIEKKYHGGKSKTLIGQSLGGLLAAEILLTSPGLFDKYIIVSPSIWWDNGSLLAKPSPLLAGATKKIYIGVGKEGLTPTDIPRVMEVDANVLADKVRSIAGKGSDVYFDYLPSEDHATIMHQAVFNALRLLFPLYNNINK